MDIICNGMASYSRLINFQRERESYFDITILSKKKKTYMDLHDDEDLKEMIRTNEYIYGYIDRRQ